jgi:hypothetical protein
VGRGLRGDVRKILVRAERAPRRGPPAHRVGLRELGAVEEDADDVLAPRGFREVAQEQDDAVLGDRLSELLLLDEVNVNIAFLRRR